MKCLDTLVRGPVAGCANQGPETSVRRHAGCSPVRIHIRRSFSDPGVRQWETSIHLLGRQMWGEGLAVWRGQRAYPTGRLISYRPCSLPSSHEEAVATALPAATSTPILKFLWAPTVQGCPPWSEPLAQDSEGFQQAGFQEGVTDVQIENG